MSDNEFKAFLFSYLALFSEGDKPIVPFTKPRVDTGIAVLSELAWLWIQVPDKRRITGEEMNSTELTGVVEELKEQINELEKRVHALEDVPRKALKALDALTPAATSQG